MHLVGDAVAGHAEMYAVSGTGGLQVAMVVGISEIGLQEIVIYILRGKIDPDTDLSSPACIFPSIRWESIIFFVRLVAIASPRLQNYSGEIDCYTSDFIREWRRYPH